MCQRLAVVFITFVLASCATPYQPYGLSGGFNTTQISDDAFIVEFKGNGRTGSTRATDFTLLRSAEVALENGFSYFQIVDQKYTESIRSHTTPVKANTTVNTNTSGTVTAYGNTGHYNANTTGTATTTYSGGNTYTTVKPRSTNTIQCFKEKPKGFHYNAALVHNSLKLKYKIE